jgi:[ribosomal protein S5]-alanine N-acetyltransferase
MLLENLETERLILRKVDQEIMNFVYKHYTDDELLLFFGLIDLQSLEAEKKKWEKGFSTFNKTFLYFLLMDKITSKVIGWCGYHTWYTDHHRAELGYGLYEEQVKNKGLMTEALKPIIEFGWSKMHLHRIEAFVSPNNLPSLKLLERFSFDKEGFLNEHYLKQGIYEDSLVFSRIKRT